ncbi:type III pantothenate kinase [Pseudarcicella hirudinis]|uniref:Type III pantothenate kinase n=1 Tax=Pseudarcicella hirudinis TaxID=1079859 RepID=A0A1I5RM22_9BACT|nr:type III pantothenate kinase [Pseudarcicella hirudinis]SFP59407.1 type III pantothenate kinase [Pseudarcicella hirudinis]
MLLAIDIGNTDVVFGIHDGKSWIHQFRVSSSLSGRPADFEAYLRLRFLENSLKISEISKSIISCVVPDMKMVLKMMVEEMFGISPVMVGPEIYPSLKMEILSPYEIGTDLVANATYAYYTYRKNCVIVDFGTALTFTVISAEGKILGVSIAPGLKTAVKSLFSNTAQLPEVPLVMPDSAIGKNTVHAIQAGILWGYVGMVKEMIQQIRKEVGEDCKILATGGLSSILTPLQSEFDEVDKSLTLNGLKIISEITES